MAPVELETLEHQHLVEVSWLVRLRWLSAAGLLAILAASVAGAVSAWAPLLAAALLVGCVSNLGLASIARRSRPSDVALSGFLALDVALLTTVLVLTGGSSNPFAVLYLVPIVLGALLVRPALAAGLFALATSAYGSLFLFGPAPGAHHDAGAMQVHLGGMFLAYALVGALLAFAVVRIRAALAVADRRERAARDLQGRAERLAAMATLAAGAAHELATPLSTIMVITGELRHRSQDPATRSDLEELAQEVERCRSVLDQLAMDAGQGPGETWDDTDLRTLLEGAVEPGSEPVQVEVPEDVTVRLPVNLVGQALRRLLGNARLASEPGDPILLRGRLDADGVHLDVTDTGVGIPPELLPRVVEPFFTTRETGLGRGLGLFFVHGLMRQLGGELELDSVPGRGTRASLHLPQGAPGD